MPQLRFLCPKIPDIRGTRGHLDRNTFNNLEAIPFDTNDLPGVVGNQLDLVQAEIRQNLSANSIVAEIRLESQLQIGFDGITPMIL
jgi:hypothetical protein